MFALRTNERELPRVPVLVSLLGIGIRDSRLTVMALQVSISRDTPRNIHGRYSLPVVPRVRTG